MNDRFINSAIFATAVRDLLHRLEKVTTMEQFAEAMADFRAPRQGKSEKRYPRKLENGYQLPSTRQLQGCPDLPSRNEISEWDNGKGAFTERQVYAYLRRCHVTGDRLKACISYYRRIVEFIPQSPMQTPVEADSRHSTTCSECATPLSHISCEINELAEYLLNMLPSGARVSQLLEHKREIVFLLYSKLWSDLILEFRKLGGINEGLKMASAACASVSWGLGA